MKVAFISHSPGTGGAEHSLVTLLTEALDRGHEVTVSLPVAGNQPIRQILPTSKRLTVVSHRWVRMMQGRMPRLTGPARLAVGLIDAYRFRDWLRAEGADVVVVNSTTIPQASLGARLAETPAVTMIREAIRTNPALPSFLPKRAIAWLIRHQSTATIAVFEYVSAQIGTATHVVYPEVPLRSDTEKTGESQTGLRLVMAGTLSREKGQWDAVKAVAGARSRGVDARLDIYGQAQPKRLSALRSAIEEAGLQGVVRHLGETRTMMDVFASADASIVCSRNEAFGRVTAESINAGTPVIGYALGGTSEILKAGGGLLCEPDPGALADRLTQLATEPQLLRHLRTNCRAMRETGGIGGRAATVLDIIEAIATRGMR